jgi:hypothetical protein
MDLLAPGSWLLARQPTSDDRRNLIGTIDRPLLTPEVGNIHHFPTIVRIVVFPELNRLKADSEDRELRNLLTKSGG